MAERPHQERLNPLVELTRARLVEFLREPEALFWSFAFPVLLALALGIAFRERPAERYRVAVVDASGALPELLAAATELEVKPLTDEEAERSLRKAQADVILRATGGAPRYAFELDPSRPESRAARLATADALQRALGRADVAEIGEQRVEQPGARYIDFLIPGLIGLNLMGSGMWGIGFSVVTARNRNLLKRLFATPMRRSHFLLSYILSRLVFLVLEVAALTGFGWLVFGVAVRGSLAALAVVALVGAFVFAGLGLLVAARPRTQEAVSGWMNLVMLPMWLLSGSFFSYERFPEWAIPAIKALPLTATNDALRAVINDAAPLHACAVPLALMLGWTLVSFVLALKLFRWQ